MAEDVIIVNDSIECFSQEGVRFESGSKNANLLYKSKALKSLICRWKVLELCFCEVVRTMMVVVVVMMMLIIILKFVMITKP